MLFNLYFFMTFCVVRLNVFVNKAPNLQTMRREAITPSIFIDNFLSGSSLLCYFYYKFKLWDDRFH